jgi:hypothetical protein
METNKPIDSGYETGTLKRVITPENRVRLQQFANFRLRESDDPLIAQMKPGYQAILRSNDGYTAMAQNFNIPIGTVRSRLHRARAALVLLRQKTYGAPG